MGRFDSYINITVNIGYRNRANSISWHKYPWKGHKTLCVNSCILVICLNSHLVLLYPVNTRSSSNVLRYFLFWKPGYKLWTITFTDMARKCPGTIRDICLPCLSVASSEQFCESKAWGILWGSRNKKWRGSDSILKTGGCHLGNIIRYFPVCCVTCPNLTNNCLMDYFYFSGSTPKCPSWRSHAGSTAAPGCTVIIFTFIVRNLFISLHIYGDRWIKP